MYWSWVNESYSKAEQKLKNLKLQYHQENREFNDAKQLADLDILKKHEIIGLTTSCAARLHLTLHGLHAPIGNLITSSHYSFHLTILHVLILKNFSDS